MNTEKIAESLSTLGKLMELHGENSFKVNAVKNIAFRLSKTNPDFSGMSKEQIEKIDGIGKGAAAKIYDLKETGTTAELELFYAKTPTGVIEMMEIKGIGPKKVKIIWQEMGIESVGELYYACNENRLVSVKGFGQKTQAAIIESIEFRKSNEGKTHFGRIIEDAEKLIEKLKSDLSTNLISLTGAIYRKCEIIEKIEILIAGPKRIIVEDYKNEIRLPLEIIYCDEDEFYFKLVQTSSTPDHFSSLNLIESKNNICNSEKEVYEKLKLNYCVPELREGLNEVELSKAGKIPPPD